jgi:hypothetical protein
LTNGERQRQQRFERVMGYREAPATWGLPRKTDKRRFCVPHREGRLPARPDAECFACRRDAIAARVRR